MNNKISFEMDLTAIFVQDKSGGFSSFFAEFPEAIAQGSSKEEALSNLKDIFSLMLNDKKQEMESEIKFKGVEYTTEHLKMATA